MPEQETGNDSGWRPSKRMEDLAKKLGMQIPGTESVGKEKSLVLKEKGEELNETANDIDFVLAKVPHDLRGSTENFLKYQNDLGEAKERLEEKGIDLDVFIKKGKTSDPEENLSILGQNKATMRGIVEKMRGGVELSNDEKKIVDQVSIKKEDLKTHSDLKTSTQEKKEDVVDVVEQPKEQPNKTDKVTQKLLNIANYPSVLEKKIALKSLRKKLVSEGETAETIAKVDEAAFKLLESEEKDIKEHTEKGEMRPEIKKAVENYYTELEKRYDSGGRLINYFQLSVDIDLKKHLTDMGDLGSDGMKVATELEKELFDIGVLHDLSLMVNTRNAVDQEIKNYAGLLKGEQFDRLIHLRDRLLNGKDGDSDFVLQNLALLDEEGRNLYYNGTNGEVLVLENEELKKNILDRVGGRKMYLQIASDLYRITGGDARYGIAGRAHLKDGSWVINKNGDEHNGDFFRGAMNRRKEFAGTVDKDVNGVYRVRYWPTLLKHLDSGISSYWENLWKQVKKSEPSDEIMRLFYKIKEIGIVSDKEAGIPPREYAFLTKEALRSLRLGVSEPGKANLPNEINYSGWLDDIGRVAGTMAKERAFMTAAVPNFQGFKSLLGEEYFPIIAKRRVVKNGNEVKEIEINRDQYLLERLGDLVENCLESNIMTPNQIANELEEYRKSGFMFKSEKQLEDFMKKYKIPMSELGKGISNLQTFGKKFSGGPAEKNQAYGVVGKTLAKLVGGIFKEIIK